MKDAALWRQIVTKGLHGDDNITTETVARNIIKSTLIVSPLDTGKATERSDGSVAFELGGSMEPRRVHPIVDNFPRPQPHVIPRLVAHLKNPHELHSRGLTGVPDEVHCTHESGMSPDSTHPQGGRIMTTIEASKAKHLLSALTTRVETIALDTGGAAVTAHWTDGGQKLFYDFEALRLHIGLEPSKRRRRGFASPR